MTNHVSTAGEKGAIPMRNFDDLGSSFVLPALTFDFRERDCNYRLTVVGRRRALRFPK